MVHSWGWVTETHYNLFNHNSNKLWLIIPKTSIQSEQIVHPDPSRFAGGLVPNSEIPKHTKLGFKKKHV